MSTVDKKPYERVEEARENLLEIMTKSQDGEKFDFLTMYGAISAFEMAVIGYDLSLVLSNERFNRTSDVEKMRSLEEEFKK